MAPPKKPIKWDQIEAMAGLGLSVKDISHVVGVHERTIQRRFATALEKGRAKIHSSLLRKQYELAMGGNVTMLIWLGKNRLGQSDRKQIGIGSTDRLEELATAVLGGLGEADDDDDDTG